MSHNKDSRNNKEVPLPPGVDDEEIVIIDDCKSTSKGHNSDREHSRHNQSSDLINRDAVYRDLISSGEDRDYRNLNDNSADQSKDYDRKRKRDRSRDREKSGERKWSREQNRNRERDKCGEKSKSSERERSRERRRSRERDRSRHRDRSRERHRDHSRDRHWNKDTDFNDDIPNSTILLRNLPLHITEDEISFEITRLKLYPKKVFLPKAGSDGSSLVEFKLLSDAVRWKELTQGIVYFGQTMATLHYFSENRIKTRQKIIDWLCAVCGTNNFGKRESCYKCCISREESNKMACDGIEEVSHSPSTTLLFRNLDVLTTEERVLDMMGQISAQSLLNIKSLKVPKDPLTNVSKGCAYVEMRTIIDSMKLYELLSTMAGKFFVDGRCISVSYCVHSLTNINTIISKNAISNEMPTAQWTSQGSTNQYTPMFSESQKKQMQTVQSLNSGYATANSPNVTAYQYDPTSGFYYDPSTGYYYDPNSQYYYNCATRQYLYWDAQKQSYTVVPSADGNQPAGLEVATATQPEAVISSPAVISQPSLPNTKKDEEKKPDKGEKAKSAKQIAKDMEKWAKTLNQKKREYAKTNTPVVVKPPEESNVASSSSEASKLEQLVLLQAMEAEAANGSMPDNFLIPGNGRDLEPEQEFQDEATRALEFLKAEEEKLVDYLKLTCLLCKRQFPSGQVLFKHVEKSDLHKQNVNMLKLTKLTPAQLVEIEKKESGYRDRAKERRMKFGQPDMPAPSRLKAKYMKERTDTYKAPEPPAEALGNDNIGNKMLKAMGWEEGKGLGKTGQGMSGIIEVQRRTQSAGLGMKGSTYGANASDSYKETVRKAMFARYNDVS